MIGDTYDLNHRTITMGCYEKKYWYSHNKRDGLRDSRHRPTYESKVSYVEISKKDYLNRRLNNIFWKLELNNDVSGVILEYFF
jgi:hypothetical protein